MSKQELQSAPIPMVLHCPKCGKQHLDIFDGEVDWSTRLHRTHKCANTPQGPNTGCGMLFRPAHVSTVGVLELPARDEMRIQPDPMSALLVEHSTDCIRNERGLENAPCTCGAERGIAIWNAALAAAKYNVEALGRADSPKYGSYREACVDCASMIQLVVRDSEEGPPVSVEQFVSDARERVSSIHADNGIAGELLSRLESCIRALARTSLTALSLQKQLDQARAAAPASELPKAEPAVGQVITDGWKTVNQIREEDSRTEPAPGVSRGTSMWRDDWRMVRWCVFTISKGYVAEREGRVAAHELLSKLELHNGKFEQYADTLTDCVAMLEKQTRKLVAWEPVVRSVLADAAHARQRGLGELSPDKRAALAMPWELRPPKEVP